MGPGYETGSLKTLILGLLLLANIKTPHASQPDFKSWENRLYLELKGPAHNIVITKLKLTRCINI